MIVGTGVDLAEVPRIRASIERFGPVKEREQAPLETFGVLSESHGIAVDDASESATLYATQRAADDVEVFEDDLFPSLTTAYSEVSETGVTLEGVVSPEGKPITACHFEYGTTDSYGQSVPCKQTLQEIVDALRAHPVAEFVDYEMDV